MAREEYVITCTAGQHYSFWFVRLQLRNEEFSNIFLMSSKGVRISLNKQRALHIESKLAFSTLKVLFYSLSLRRVSTKLWGVMNSILFDYQSQPTRPRKSENSLIEFYLLNWSIFDAPNRVNLERNRQKKSLHYESKLMNFFSIKLCNVERKSPSCKDQMWCDCQCLLKSRFNQWLESRTELLWPMINSF